VTEQEATPMGKGKPDWLCCPVCNYPLRIPAWHDGLPSFDICPCCGTQFGYDDCCGGDVNARAAWYRQARARWIAGGMVWWSPYPAPAGWDARMQLAAVGCT
jgi:hypothetical protein